MQRLQNEVLGFRADQKGVVVVWMWRVVDFSCNYSHRVLSPFPGADLPLETLQTYTIGKVGIGLRILTGYQLAYEEVP